MHIVFCMVYMVMKYKFHLHSAIILMMNILNIVAIAEYIFSLSAEHRESYSN